jgi:protein-S-isoprenylcysteine O-methyltransferase Ste14
MSPFTRLFGSGPLGVALSVVLTWLALVFRRLHPEGDLCLPPSLRWTVLILGTLGAFLGVLWSFRSLPVQRRGYEPCTAGAYHWVRHPLYASFISLAAPGVAVLINHWIAIAWLIALHCAWHLVIPWEEKQMLVQFGDAYRKYAKRTGRFLPRVHRGVLAR